MRNWPKFVVIGSVLLLGAPLMAQTATIVQANVSAAGLNIPGDAANEPSIAVDPTNPNRIAIGWRQFDTVSSSFRQAGYGYSSDGGRHWSASKLTPGVFRSDPVLDSDPDGRFFYYSLTLVNNGNDYECNFFQSTNGGAAWSNPPAYGYGGDKEWMSTDKTAGIGRGNVYAFWNQYYSCCGPVDFTRSTNHGASFETPLSLPEQPYWGTIAVGPDGEVYAFGDSGISPYFVVLRSDNAQNPAQTPVFNVVGTLQYDQFGTIAYGEGPNPGGLLGQGWIAVDNSNGPRRGFVYLLWSLVPPDGAHPVDVRFSRSADGGQTWSAPISVNKDAAGNGAYHWFGTMSVAPNGRIDAVWNDTRDSGQPNLSRLYYSSSSDGGLSWSADVALSGVWDSFVGWPQQQKIGDYSHMVSDNDGANLAMAATLNGEQDVYFVRIGPFPCWGDLTGDRRVDLSDLALLLANYGGAVPQSGGDLNNNGVVDLSDLATELSLYATVCP